ncbi:aarF domain-containing protein kinase 1-like [Liolophura sinensis]|uniref:aarF domain-containing protein kinase 1-like n=1 Tax=Liolophura sinensis TaxID=3198878 RepID=UPI0031591A98
MTGLRRLAKIASMFGVTGGTVFIIKKNDWEISTVGALRFGRAAVTAARIVCDYKMTMYHLNPEDEQYADKRSQLHTRSAVRLRELCCANGGAFIKVGQHLGALDYLLPAEYVQTLKVLHSEAPQSSLEDLYSVIEEDLGKKVSEIFTTFDPQPLGAASLAQVHKATLRDGRVVAVKVQHVKVKAHSFVDIKTMEILVKLVAWLFPDFQYVWLAEETKKNLPLELDFLNEGRNCERVGRMFKHFRFLKVPAIYWDLSSERVLTMEFCEGGKVDNRDYMTKHGISVNEVTRSLGKLYSEMIFVHGYVHCDPHPGNVLVKKTDQGVEISLLDHGLYQSLTDEFRVNYSKLWMSLINADQKGIKHYSSLMNAGDLYPLFACMLTARSWTAVSSGIANKEFSAKEGEEIKSSVADYFPQISQILNRIPRQMLLLLKTNDVLRSIEHSLKTRSNATSFINMSRCCIRSVGQYELQHCQSRMCKIRVSINTHWHLFVISVYEFSLWLQSTVMGQTFSRIFKHRVI